MSRRVCTLARALTLLVVFGAAVGCSSGKRGATVKGTVTYKGETLRSGTVVFHSGGSPAASAQIQPDGTYVSEGVPQGEVVATVETVGGNIMHGQPKGLYVPGAAKRAKESVTPAPSFAPPSPEAGPPLPDKFKKPESSGLKYTVDGSEAEIDIALN